MVTLEIIAKIIVACIGLYIITRIITRAGLDEVDKFLNKKSSKIKKQENGTEEKEK